MQVILDACTLINLINGASLQTVLSIPEFSFFVGDILLDSEILNPAQKLIIDAHISKGHIVKLTSIITLQEFLIVKQKFDLGDGETEGIALCKKGKYSFASDDWKARRSGVIEIGDAKVIGTLFLLRETVRQSLMTIQEAISCIQLMKQKGAFLPEVGESYFS